MKKKFLDCPIHGETLHRCKRKYWNMSTSKETKYSSDYSEKCFKCINKGQYRPKVKKVYKRHSHTRI